jgi:hypothetical protein
VQDLLLTCLTGAGQEGFAQALANELGVPVMAPTGVLKINPSGAMEILNGGYWKTFTPTQ